MYNVSIVGAGQLGSRHLQALCLTELEVNITVIDPNEGARVEARSRFDSMPSNERVRSIVFSRTVEDLPSVIHLCIVSCCADARRRVIEEVLRVAVVENFLLEKNLFQRVADYEAIGSEIAKLGVKTWVNCPMRTWPVYRFVKSELTESEIFEINVRGSNWRLCTNCIHFLDLIAFLVGCARFEINNELLDRDILESKRPGFIEFSGTVEGYFEKTRFSISSNRRGEVPLTVQILADSHTIVYSQTKGNAFISRRENDWDWETKCFTLPPQQSESTHLVAREILLRGSAGLPTFEESVAIHVPMVRSFIDHYNEQTNSASDLCPIA